MKALLFLSGLFTLSVQSALVRQVLSAGGANELVLGALFGAWLLGVSAGARAARLFPLEEPEAAAPSARRAALLFLPAALLQWTGALFLKPLTGTAPGDYFSLWSLLPVLLVLGTPVSLLTGWIFSRASAATAGAGPGRASTRAYALEALGSLAGGGAFTLLLALGGNSLQGILIPGALLAAWCAASARRPAGKEAFLHGAAALAALAAALWPGDPLGRSAGEAAFSRLLPGATLLERRETPYGLLEIARLDGRLLVYRDGSPSAVVPGGEASALQAGILAAQPAKRRKALLLGLPGPTLLADLLEFPWKEIVAVEPDGTAREALGRFLPRREKKAWNSRRVSWVEDDPRPFLAEEASRRGPFDLVVLSCHDPGRAGQDRLFTREALLAVRRVLAKGGVLALGAPLVERAFDKEKLAFGLTLLATLESVFPKVELLPGVRAWFLASPIDGSPTADGVEMEKRLAAAGALPSFLPKGALASACDPFQARSVLDFLHRRAALLGEAPLHTDGTPRLFFAGLTVQTRYRDPATARFLEAFHRAGPPAAFWPPAVLLLLLLLRLAAASPDEGSFRRETALLTAFLGGASGIVLFLVLLLTFQLREGLLFQKVALVSGLFLAGMALAAFAAGRRGGPVLPLLISAIGYFALSLAGPGDLAGPVVQALFLPAGFAAGLAFPAGAALLAPTGMGEGEIASRLEGADHLGAALGGAAAGVLLIPALGLQGTIRYCALFSAALLLFLLAGPGRPGSLLSRAAGRLFPGAAAGPLPPGAGFPWPRLGFLLLWAGAVVLGLVPLLRRAARQERTPFPAGVERILGAHRIRLEARPFPHGLALKKDRSEPLGTLFATSALVSHVYGYAGPIDLLVVFDEEGIIRHVQVLSWDETPAYVEGTEEWLRKNFVGRKLGEAFVLRGEEGGRRPGVVAVDGMAGATITSRALVEILTRAGAKARALLAGSALPRGRKRPAPPPGPPFWYLLLAFPLGTVVYLAGGKRARRLFLASSFLLGGLWWGLQLAPATLASAWLHGFSPRPELLLLAAGGLAAALLAGPAYCAVLCPFGAVQDACSWLGLLGRTDPRRDRYFRSIKYFLLFALVLAVGLTGSQEILAFDPLAAAFGPGRTAWTAGLLALILFASLFFYRFWCRSLCPLGALFQLFTPTAPLLRQARRPRPAACDTGILHPAEADCLHCRRCLTGETAPPRSTWRSALPQALLLAGALFLSAGAAGRALFPEPARLPAPEGGAASLGGPRKIDAERVRRLLKRGDLSPHPARYHE